MTRFALLTTGLLLLAGSGCCGHHGHHGGGYGVGYPPAGACPGGVCPPGSPGMYPGAYPGAYVAPGATVAAPYGYQTVAAEYVPLY